MGNEVGKQAERAADGSLAESAPAPRSRVPRETVVRLESVLVLLGLSAILAVVAPNFLSLGNFVNILLATAVIGLLAVGATFVLAAAGLDLSLGSQLALTGIAGAILVKAGAPWYAGLLGALGAGACTGLINGWLVTRAKIPAFIVTLGTLSIARGLALILSNGQPIYGMPEQIRFLGQGRPFGLPTPVILFILVVAVGEYVLRNTRYGQHTLAIGDNEMAARVMGINVERHRWSLYMVAGLLAGLAGLVFMGRLNAADPTAGVTYELDAITAAVIGGTALFGGRGTVLGTFVGALIIGVLRNGLNLLAVPSFYQQLAVGTVLIAAVWLDRIRENRG